MNDNVRGRYPPGLGRGRGGIGGQNYQPRNFQQQQQQQYVQRDMMQQNAYQQQQPQHQQQQQQQMMLQIQQQQQQQHQQWLRRNQVGSSKESGVNEFEKIGQSEGLDNRYRD